MSPTSASPSQVPQVRRTARACDACKLRKVKCNGQERCQQCSHLNLRCVYSIPKPRTKSLKRGQLIAKYKEATITKEVYESQAEQTTKTTRPISSRQENQIIPAATSGLSDSPSSFAASSPQHDTSFFYNFLHDYEVSVYPVNPIITVDEVRQAIDERNINQEARAFVFAYVAVTINLTGYSTERASDTTAQVEFWSFKAANARGPPLPGSKANVRKIMTTQFLHICLMGLRDIDMAFYYLRESISMIQMLKIYHPEAVHTLSLQERARRQRLYCEAFVHERYLAILDYRPIVLPPPNHMPEDDPSLSPSIHEGFKQIIRIFQLIDHEFVGNWLGSHGGNAVVTSAWIENKQKEIDAEHAGDDEQVSRLSELQQADLIITKHWLRTLVWQMAMSKCLLSSAASKESMSLLFPVRLSKQLRSLVCKISRQSVEIHGSGIQQKLFELTDTIANVVITVPASTVEETAGRVDDFMFLVHYFFSLPRFDPMRRDILQKKLEKLQSMFPYSANTPDSTLPAGVIERDDREEDDPWLGVIKGSNIRGYNGGFHDGLSPQSPLDRPPQAPARMWQDVTRRLSLAPAAYNEHVPGPHMFQTH